jgi:hypothetical protein
MDDEYAGGRPGGVVENIFTDHRRIELPMVSAG